jgi:hypothetical protein
MTTIACEQAFTMSRSLGYGSCTRQNFDGRTRAPDPAVAGQRGRSPSWYHGGAMNTLASSGKK